ncbi:MAG: hypothetical protein BM564_11670 [Bacteroidetes bacterium MedPE-SWsnd-G2]|nr:MAG: hypothetical protein BM564_11670 [Bacteroidetes bacterium MedPE-SWsnd-G2]
MTNFIETVVADLILKEVDFSNTIFVLPSKRAGTFLRNSISEQLKQTIFAPEIFSTEEFIASICQMEYATPTELLFFFYDVYLSTMPEEEKESFDSFSKWAQIILQDFNEIDRFLIPPKQIFDYLGAIQDINHWSVATEQTTQIKSYLKFWNALPLYYSALKKRLININRGYQGLVYREAVSNLEAYKNATKTNRHVFIGFNALNKAEENIIQELLDNDNSDIYWDIDQCFLDNTQHDAGHFMRQHKKNWHYFRTHPFNWATQDYQNSKQIKALGAPKNVGQIKLIGQLIEDLKSSGHQMQKTAVVLGNESLLLPLLNSIPENVGPINITMGMPLNTVPLAALFEDLFRIHKTKPTKYYHKDIRAILSNPQVNALFQDEQVNYAQNILQHLQKENKTYLKTEELIKLCPPKECIIELLFGNWANHPTTAIKSCKSLLFALKTTYQDEPSKNALILEYLYRFLTVFNELETLNKTHNHIYTVSTLHILYREIIKSETLDFQGEPLKGLQIMGMLESRVLDFETVIISSVNEGILPAGKSNNSFIPFDVKLEHNLPTYKEKDAVYTYHFYRLLQRAKNVYIIYNTQADVLKGGEKSRFITQLEIENRHKIHHEIVVPKAPKLETNLKSVIKTEGVIERLKQISKNGFSPSSLTNYIRNPIDFYKQSILRIRSFEDVEETVAANTLGSVIHHVLEEFYEPYIDSILKEEYISKMIPKIKPTVEKYFKEFYKEGDLSSGQNLIIFEIAQRLVLNFLKTEKKQISEGNDIIILSLEADYKIKLDFDELDYPVYLRGAVDRVDLYNGTLRIIDYKTGKVDASQVSVIDWEDITTDYKKYSKSFQVLCYALMLQQASTYNLPYEAGIISFKNLNASDSFLKFHKKESSTSRTKDTQITQETLDAFYAELKTLILEINNISIPFDEKEV